MESSGLIGSAFRRWYVTLLGLVATLGLCALALQLVPAKYEATARVLLLPPASTVQKGGNPYLQLGGLDAAVSILGRSMSDAENQLALQAAGSTAKFTIGPDDLTSGPVLLLTADAKTPAQVLGSLQIALDRVPTSLAAIQRSVSVPKASMITSTVITQDNEAKVVRKSQIRAVVVAAVAGIILTLMIAALVDVRLRRRESRRAGERAHSNVGGRGASPENDSSERLPETDKESPTASLDDGHVVAELQQSFDRGSTSVSVGLRRLDHGAPAPSDAAGSHPTGDRANDWS
jgi:hypothetical protein